MNCPDCGDILQVRPYDYGRCAETGYHDAGEYLYCDTCHKAVDEGDALDDGPEAEALREAREQAIDDRQFAEWSERQARGLAILKASCPEFIGLDDNDLERLKDVLNG